MRALAVVWLLSASMGLAQTSPEREVALAKALFDAGKYQECLTRVREVVAVTNFTDAQRIELHQLSGLSAFNLDLVPEAKQSFLALLRLNPDYVLDPFVAPPSAIRLLESVRKEAADELTLVRQLLQVRAEQQRREEEARRRAELERANRRVITVERRPMWMNFLPFGAGQFLQDRPSWGVAFAAAEALFGIASVVAYWAIEGLKVTTVETIEERLVDGGTFRRTLRGIPPSAEGARDSWRVVKWSTGGAFYLAYVLGVVDAVVRHEGDRVTERQEPPEPPPVKLNLLPLPGGGLFAGASLAF